MINTIEITNDAQDHIANVLANDNVKFFRITVLGGGCAGFQYKFDFENLRSEEDNLLKTKKIEVLIDSTSLDLIKGSKIDYVQELIGSSFKITNPQASSSCGCGTSFSI
jgi:iron-sulfur cluster assembly accessory protein